MLKKNQNSTVILSIKNFDSSDGIERLIALEFFVVNMDCNIIRLLGIQYSIERINLNTLDSPNHFYIIRPIFNHP